MDEHFIGFALRGARKGGRSGRIDFRISLSDTSPLWRVVLQYGLAPVLVATALSLALLLRPFVPNVLEYLLLAAVVASSWFGSKGSAFFAVVLASLTFDYFFLSPLHTLRISRAALPHFVLFLLSALVATWLSTTRKQAEAKSRLQTAALNASAIAIVITDVRGTIQWVNPAFTNLTGYSLEEALGQNPRIVKSGKQDESFYQNLWSTILAGKVWSGEITNRKKDGQFYVEAMTIAPVRSKTGKIISFVAVKQDLTERKKAQEATHRSELKFRTLFDSTSDAVLLLDQRGFFDCNEAAVTVFGCSAREELCSRHPADLSPPTQPSGVDSLTLANQRIATAMEKGCNHFEWVHKRADTGEIFTADVLLTAMELDSKPVVQVVIRDITQSKAAENSIRASEEQFHQLADNIHEVFFVATPDPIRIAYLSPAYEQIWGKPRQEAYDRATAWIESVHPEERESVDGFFARSIQGVQSEMTYRIIRPDGLIRWIEARSFPVRNAEGKLIRVVGIAEDTTVRRETHNQLTVALEELKEQSQETTRLAELVDILQSCKDAEEAFKITGSALASMWPSTVGALSSSALRVMLLRWQLAGAV